MQASADHAEKEQLAIALINQGKLQEAETIYKELISAGTSNHNVYGNLATLCGMQGRFDECIKHLHKLLELNPNFPEAHHNLGTALKEKGELDAAINAYSKAIELDPNDPDTHYNLGITFKAQGDLNAAVAAYNIAIQLKPNFTDAHNNLGIALKEQGDLNAAVSAYNTAIQLNPNFTDAFNNLGNALKAQGDLNAAISSYKNSLQLEPNNPETHNRIGIALQEKEDIEAAIVCFNTALQLEPNHPDTHNNLGVALQQQGYVDAAIISFSAALQLEPNDPVIHWNSSQSMLLGGDYKNGWEKYEWRFKKEERPAQLHVIPSCIKWNEGVPLEQAEQLLLVTEQGLGDTLQFMRYATTLRKKGISISFCAQPKLHSLIQASGIDQSPLTPEKANQVTEGKWIPLLSVPRHLGVSPDNPVITMPYIKTTDELTAKWAGILGAKENPVIGINWQGSPTAEKSVVRGVLRGRSLALETFAPITSNGQISLLSLQKGFGSEQLETCSFKHRFVSCQGQVNDVWDFLETAAIIANCDLVITSDTSVAHLAGGMGKTTWLLLQKVPDWRWGLDGDSTFWYPSMRLFRQKERGNWNEVMERVAEALQKNFWEQLNT